MRGEFCLLEAEVENGLPFYALCWADRKLKTIISNVGTTNPGTPSKRRRYKKEMVDGIWETVSYFKEVKRPAMVEEFFSCFSTIDRHDHLRQGSLALEREWYTHKWWHRIYATVFGMCIVDAYMAYKFDVEKAYGSPDHFRDFIGKLAYELINNVFQKDSITH